MKIRFSIRQLWAAAIVLGMYPACDCFFEATGIVVECGTMVPLPTVRVDRQLKVGVATSMTNDAGQFRVGTADRCQTWETLTFQKDGFETLQTQVKGSPDGPLQLCMTRTVAP